MTTPKQKADLLAEARKDLRRSGIRNKAQIIAVITRGDIQTDSATLKALCSWCGIPVPKQTTPKAATSAAAPTHDRKTGPRKAAAKRPARVKTARAAAKRAHAARNKPPSSEILAIGAGADPRTISVKKSPARTPRKKGLPTKSTSTAKGFDITAKPRKLKKPTVLNIEAAMDAAGNNLIKDVNIELKKKGFAPVNSRLHGGLKPTKAKSDKTDKPPALKRKRKSNYVKKGGNGGTRPGAGRKKGVSTAPAKKRTAGIADDLAASAKTTPLEYMIDVLNETPDQLIADLKAKKIESEEFMIKYRSMMERRDWAAEKAAPYLHPRLSSITANVTTPEHEQYVKDCEAELALLLAAVKK